MVYNIMPNATGPWKGCALLDTAKFATGEKGKISVTDKDRKILRDLAGRVAEIAEQEIQKKKIKLWKDHNSLKTTQPVILADPENGWNDIITEDILECEGNLARRWELLLKKDIIYAEKIKDDRPIEAIFEIGYTYTQNDWVGESGMFRGGTDGGSYYWDASVKNLDDVEKIRMPEINIDYKVTNDTLELARDVFDGLLDVRLKGIWWWTLGFTLDLVMIIGLENMMMLFYDNPGLIHAVNKKIAKGYEKKINFLTENNLLSLNNDGTYVGSGGLGYCDELPAEDFSGTQVRPADIWVLAESQETSLVSTEMFDEFIFSYQLPLIKKFGLVCYGCCEPLDKRWEVIKKIPNLRRVSVSPWAERKKMAEYLGDRYIYSMKPTPADLAVPVMDKEYVLKNMIEDMKTAKGCVVEVLMKDNHTLGGNPENLYDWVKITRQAINKIYE